MAAGSKDDDAGLVSPMLFDVTGAALASVLLSGGLVGLVLGLVGGGGSMLATPLLLYAVGLAPHRAIGTGAVAVSACAFVNLGLHARAGHVRWRLGALFATIGVAGAAGGADLGKQVDGRGLLILFALLMVVVGMMMLRAGSLQVESTADGRRNADNEIALMAASALGTGMLSGFFGVGGGFLIVPALLFSTGMPTIEAIGSSLLAVGMFGLTTSVSYALSSLVDWKVAAELVAGGFLGAVIGQMIASRLATSRTALNSLLSVLLFLVAAYMLVRSVSGPA